MRIQLEEQFRSVDLFKAIDTLSEENCLQEYIGYLSNSNQDLSKKEIDFKGILNTRFFDFYRIIMVKYYSEFTKEQVLEKLLDLQINDGCYQLCEQYIEDLCIDHIKSKISDITMLSLIKEEMLSALKDIEKNAVEKIILSNQKRLDRLESTMKNNEITKKELEEEIKRLQEENLKML